MYNAYLTWYQSTIYIYHRVYLQILILLYFNLRWTQETLDGFQEISVAKNKPNCIRSKLIFRSGKMRLGDSERSGRGPTPRVRHRRLQAVLASGQQEEATPHTCDTTHGPQVRVCSQAATATTCHHRMNRLSRSPVKSNTNKTSIGISR